MCNLCAPKIPSSPTPCTVSKVKECPLLSPGNFLLVRSDYFDKCRILTHTSEGESHKPVSLIAKNVKDLIYPLESLYFFSLSKLRQK